MIVCDSNTELVHCRLSESRESENLRVVSTKRLHRLEQMSSLYICQWAAGPTQCGKRCAIPKFALVCVFERRHGGIETRHGIDAIYRHLCQDAGGSRFLKRDAIPRVPGCRKAIDRLEHRRSPHILFHRTTNYVQCIIDTWGERDALQGLWPVIARDLL